MSNGKMSGNWRPLGGRRSLCRRTSVVSCNPLARVWPRHAQEPIIVELDIAPYCRRRQERRDSGSSLASVALADAVVFSVSTFSNFPSGSIPEQTGEMSK